MLVLVTMVVTSALLAGAWVAANAELHLTSTSTNQKKAYYAAQAGISDYLFHLTQDGAYLGYCTSPPETNTALIQRWKNGNKTAEMTTAELDTTSHSAEVPGGENERYSIQLVPAETAPSGEAECKSSNLARTMIEGKGDLAGTFRIRSTGFSGKEARTIVATFKNEGFPSFVYYTTYETADPATYYGSPYQSRAPKECDQFWNHPRPLENPETSSEFCTRIFFGTETLDGPIHSQDHVAICGSPTFGSNSADKIEFGQEGIKEGSRAEGTEATKGYSTEKWPGCSATPIFKGTYVPPAQTHKVEPPPSNTELEQVAESKYRYEGKTELILGATTMTVIKHKGSGAPLEKTETGVEYPSNGVVYVSNDSSLGACEEEFTPYGPSYGYPACGNVYIRGSYSTALTVGASNDIIIDGSLTTPTTEGYPNTAAELGLVANKFVRIYHPVETVEGNPPEECKTVVIREVWNARRRRWEKEYGTECKTSTNCPSGTTYNESTKKCDYVNNYKECDAPSIYGEGSGENLNPISGSEGTMENPEVYAAILAVNHSFTVDNYRCQGSRGMLGTLKIYGALAQRYRGIVALSGYSGYTKDYLYDERLRASEPPHFLNPVESPWKIVRETLAKTPIP